MPLVSGHDAVSRLTFTMGYACPSCGFAGRCEVPGRGFAHGRQPSEGLTEAAQAEALRNAEMRCELAPCPACGRRGWGTFLGKLGQSTLVCAALSALVAGLMWLRLGKADASWAGALLFAIWETGLLGLFAFDYRAASRVRFLPEEPPEAPPVGTAYRSAPER